jgi:hypothetical protein
VSKTSLQKDTNEVQKPLAQLLEKLDFATEKLQKLRSKYNDQFTNAASQMLKSNLLEANGQTDLIAPFVFESALSQQRNNKSGITTILAQDFTTPSKTQLIVHNLANAYES